jgi:ubiquinone/menaquinone biosynthesis C-methylase UbiE
MTKKMTKDSGARFMKRFHHFTRRFIGTTSPQPKTAVHHLTEVRTLFNAKARTWNQKYEVGGALAFRVAAFESLLAQRLFANAKVLDLGCGTAAIASVLSGCGFQVTACDIAEEMIKAGKRIYGEYGIEWCLLPSDWKQLPFNASTFDGIVASSVLEYLPDLNGVLIECQRVLKPGGILAATVPNLRTLTRKLERLIRPTVAWLNGFPGLNGIPKFHSYASYLKCSRNRMSVNEWRATGMQADFAEMEQIEMGAPNASLAFLIFRNTKTEAGQC